MPGPYRIAHVTPHPWGVTGEVNAAVARMTAGLKARGHSVLIVAPADRPDPVRRSRKALRTFAEEPDVLFDARASGLRETDAGVPVFAVGEILAVPLGASRRRPARVPIDVARTVEELLGTLELDFVHVHDPFAPSTSSAALRHSRSLNVASFHVTSEPAAASMVGRRVVEHFFGRLDARLVGFGASRTVMERHFPGAYRVITPGVSGPEWVLPPVPATRRQAPGAPSPASPTPDLSAPVRILFVEDEERAAQRQFLRALRRLPAELEWEAAVITSQGGSQSTPLSAEIRRRVTFVGIGGDGDRIAEELELADVICLASDGTRPAPALLLRALAAGVVPIATGIPVYEELLGEGERGLLFEARDTDTAAAQLARLVADRDLRERLGAAGSDLRERLGSRRECDAIEGVYDELAARRHDAPSNGRRRSRASRHAVIDVDLHMHTDHSYDCATPVEVLLAAARAQGLGAIAITDHNEISGAFEAQAKAEGIKVIVAEEVKTASQGEVIGLFLKRKIERGLTLAETIAEIKRQGGLVYVPHPFDRMHAVPDYENLLEVLDDVDAIEVFNPRVAIGAFNEEAARFAAKYRIPAGAGSDAHVPQGLGSVRVRMPDFDGPDAFMASLRQAEIVTNPANLLYVQALKFLQTKATPPAARAARRTRRVRRATR